MAYTRYFMATPPMRKQIKRKEIQKTDNPEAWLLIESLYKTHIIETTPTSNKLLGCEQFPLSALSYGLVKKREDRRMPLSRLGI
jgi:hypothetical protein